MGGDYSQFRQHFFLLPLPEPKLLFDCPGRYWLRSRTLANVHDRNQGGGLKIEIGNFAIVSRFFRDSFCEIDSRFHSEDDGKGWKTKVVPKKNVTGGVETFSPAGQIN